MDEVVMRCVLPHGQDTIDNDEVGDEVCVAPWTG